MSLVDLTNTPAAKFIVTTGAELDRALVNRLFPELVGSSDGRDHVRLATACEQIRRFREAFSQTFADAVRDVRQHQEKSRDLLKDAVKEMESMVARNQELASELRAAKELRGLHESEKVKAAEKELAESERKLVNTAFTLHERDKELAEARQANQGLLVSIGDLGEQLKQARAARDEAQRKAETAGILLDSALEKIADRWPKPLPFVASIAEDVRKAKENLK